ncbi:hypothetical protein [Tolypothrix sp. VBCCA 56010]|uniref:hypothetical protein n=1 Tax=Tolypothrix sp. VBCCA 56010 TaxID=3137731 RepID=UPI003D7D418D
MCLQSPCPLWGQGDKGDKETRATGVGTRGSLPPRLACLHASRYNGGNLRNALAPHLPSLPCLPPLPISPSPHPPLSLSPSPCSEANFSKIIRNGII